MCVVRYETEGLNGIIARSAPSGERPKKQLMAHIARSSIPVSADRHIYHVRTVMQIVFHDSRPVNFWDIINNNKKKKKKRNRAFVWIKSERGTE